MSLSRVTKASYVRRFVYQESVHHGLLFRQKAGNDDTCRLEMRHLVPISVTKEDSFAQELYEAAGLFFEKAAY